MINFVKVFLATTKALAAKKFDHLLVYFKRRFNGKIHESGVAHQSSEARNQASNGKAERMHRTIMNSDAVQYAVYVIERSPKNAKPVRVSPLKLSTAVVPALREIVVFGSRAWFFVISGTGRTIFHNEASVVLLVEFDNQRKRSKTPKSSEAQTTKSSERYVETKVNVISKSQARMQLLTRKIQFDKLKKKTSERTRERPLTRSMQGNNGGKTQLNSIEEIKTAMVNLTQDVDPRNYGEAIRSPQKNAWVSAMKEELTVLEENGV
uniref:AlNc14C180G8204 protein n=1 Tax=Albugo laibachii Nc14 TaxID=890382 RepID=F0WP57_9STRA|nr:AlNc14C180G8204 [Albugo laibachii Nc14]|eukprot:CCA23101.1 AlNc14C180G8204 [Albugo laibachii Nc14]